MTTTSASILPLNSQVQLGSENFMVQDAGNNWNVTMPDANTVRFVVQSGDHWSNDPTTKERSELASQTTIANGTPINVAYNMDVEPGSPNTSAFVVLGQLHQDQASQAGIDGLAPPFSIGLVGEKMVVNIGYVGLDGQPANATLFTDSADIVRGHNYAINVQVTFDPNGNGHLVVTRDGVTIVNYSGPLGYSDQNGVYWKEGIYRADAPETLAADYSNLAISTGAPSTSVTSSVLSTSSTSSTSTTPPSTLHFNRYNNMGILISSTTNNADGSATYVTYDNTGALLKTEIDAANGSRQIWDYQITGKSYVSDERVYNSAGVLIQFIASDATGKTLSNILYTSNGTLSSSTSYNSDGSTTLNTYNSTGTMIKTEIDYANGAKTVWDYGVVGQSYVADQRVYNAAGVLTQWVQTHANGSTDTYDYSVTGASYVSDHVVTSASGQILSVTRYHADGSLSSSQTLNSDGSTSYNTYSTTGVLTRTENDATNGTRHIWDYGLTGTGFASDQRVYNAAGVLIQYITQDAQGNILSNIAYNGAGAVTGNWFLNSDGSKTTDTYTPAGVLTTMEVDAINGSKHFWDYGIVGKTYTSDERFYNTAGVLTEMITKNADGSKQISDYYASASSKLSDYIVLNAAGNVTSAAYYNVDGTQISGQSLNADGSRTYNTYGVGNSLVKTEIDLTNGTKHLYDYGIVGQSYIADERFYTAANVLSEFIAKHADGSRDILDYSTTGTTYLVDHIIVNATGQTTSSAYYHADGSLSSSFAINTDGSTTTKTYDGTGNLLRTEIDSAAGKHMYDYGVTGKTYTSDDRVYNTAGVLTQMSENFADGTKQTSDFGITGQSYTSDLLTYGANHSLTSIQQFHADGSLSFAETFATNGTVTQNIYDSTGHLTETLVTQTGGVEQLQAFTANVVLAGGAANDTITSFGGDTLVFKGSFGNDVVNNFHAGSAANHDVIQLDPTVVPNFAHLVMAQQGTNVVITVDAHDSIILHNTVMTALTTSNFLFH